MSLNGDFNRDTKEENDHFFKSALAAKVAKAAEKFQAAVNDIKIEYLSRLGKKAKIGIGVGLLGLAVISSAVMINLDSNVYAVNISGKQVGYIEEEQLLDQTLEEIKADLSKVSGGLEIIVDENELVSTATELKDKNTVLLTQEELKQKILDANVCKAKAWAININGSNIAAAASEKEALSVLEGVKNNYKTDGSELVSASFKESVSVTQAAVSTADIMKPENAIALIVTGNKEPMVYIVKDGDTVWDIALANNMSTDDLVKANPGFDPNKLKIGQQLNLYEVKPFVTVQTKEIVAATEKIDFKTVYEKTSALYKGETKVKSAGAYGQKEVKTEVTKENGVVVAANVISTTVIAEPKDQVALKGTKALTAYAGSGSGALSKPMSKIQVSSAFGSRGGGRHTGVDLRNPKGTPIKAADSGVVKYAAYSGSYGNIVRISHGNGLETWYAHCDSMSVSVGQKVSKGETIATVGRTGRATGYHLHFEVRKNGVPQNPMSYL